MSNLGRASTSRQQDDFEDDEIFDDSTFLANFDNTSFKQAKVTEGNLNCSLNTSALNVSALCCDEEISGYDKLTGKTWIYPTNYPVRDYQFNIINAALVKNTLVSLPTGLGKTFIAAVIMYNFYRWYPLGKIVFTAPTRPLVAQQIDACYNIIAIPPNDTIEMTGHMAVNVRKAHWQNKRVFFATPQVIYNDLKSGICPADKIRCLVIDEAHRARGNYAYCQIVSTLDEMSCKTYRMLALSATPGSKVEDVINVVKSLHIAHLELRTENCIDVAPYSHSRKISTVIVQLGPELTHLRQQYVEILDGYARRLKQLNILPQNLGNLSKGRIVMLYKEYQTKDRGQRHPSHNYIMKDFTILIALYHGLELLVKHGCRVFLNFFDEHPEKSWIQADDNLTALLERLRDDLGVNPLSLDRSVLPDGTIPEIPKDLCFGHPKFDKLKSIIMDHFTTAKRKNQDTRAIIFCEYRESVNLVHCLLLQCRPLISPQMFVGQGASGKDGKAVVSQKQQLRVMRSFREGQCNTLVATCVAEEGLDVGSVDLIICFDISTKSPIRLVQRCGRTGRERGGQVYILVTEGREHQTLVDCMRQRDGLNKRILQSREVEHSLYKANPRMMPRDFTPQCQKMFITVAKKEDKKDPGEKTAKKGQKDLRSMLLSSRASSGSSSSKDFEQTHLINETEFKQKYPEGYRERRLFQTPNNYWACSKEKLKTHVLMNDQDQSLNLSRWLEWQRTSQKTINIGHSKDGEFLSNFLQKCDSKRLEMTQRSHVPALNTQEFLQNFNHEPQNISVVAQSPIKNTKQSRKKQKANVAKSPGKNYGDIRALFSTATKSTKNYTKLINDLDIQNDGSVSTTLLNLLVDLKINVDDTNNTKTCYVCKNLSDCKFFKKNNNTVSEPEGIKKFLSDPILPDLDLIKEIDSDAILKCRKETHSSQNISINGDKNITITSECDYANRSSDFDLEFDLDGLEEIKTSHVLENAANTCMSNENFNLGDIEDIFAVSSPEAAMDTNITKDSELETLTTLEEKPAQTQEVLGFFNLDSIDDIFADYEDDVKEINNLQTNNSYEKEEPELVEKIDVNQHKEDNNHKVCNQIEHVKDETWEPQKECSKKPEIESNNACNTMNPGSPSILSGTQSVKKLTQSPKSPILCTQQRRKLQLSTNKTHLKSSTPNPNSKRKLFQTDPHNNNVIVIEDEEEPITKGKEDVTEQSMFTITQILEMINKTQDNSFKVSKIRKLDGNEKDKDRSPSPILLTQADKKRLPNFSSSTKASSKSLIILDSDSEDDITQKYDVEEAKESLDFNISERNERQTNGKRKFEEEVEISSSPYFNKKPKLDSTPGKSLTLQEKVLAALNSNKAKDNINKNTFLESQKPSNKPNQNNQTNFQVSVSPPKIFTQKENFDPLHKVLEADNFDSPNDVQQSPLAVLQKYRKENKLLTLRSKFDSIFKKSPQTTIESPNKCNKSDENSDEMTENNIRLSSPIIASKINTKNTPVKRKIYFDESDDDFIDDNNTNLKSKDPAKKLKENHSKAGRKKRKKTRAHNSFIEMEASLSGDSDSGDEMSDESAGSIADFIDDCDDTRDDIQAIYLKSVRSPVKKNGFKIPELPKKYKRDDIFSQFVEEDEYEMDSFCVDSHIGLTQIDDVSELELAELSLEEKKKRSKNKTKLPSPQTQADGDSPLVRKVKKKCKRQIESDSDDSG